MDIAKTGLWSGGVEADHKTGSNLDTGRGSNDSALVNIRAPADWKMDVSD